MNCRLNWRSTRMPIKPENLKLYPANWREIVAEIRARSGNKCEQCGVANGITIFRFSDGTRWVTDDGKVFESVCGGYVTTMRGSELPDGKYVRIVLTTAHLDHNPANNGEPGNRPNLAYLCQKDHLTYDAAHHAQNARQTRRSRKAIGDMFEAAGK